MTPAALKTAISDGFLDGTVSLDITETNFNLKEYRAFLAANASSIGAFKSSQQAAFDAERARWQAADQTGAVVDGGGSVETSDDAVRTLLARFARESEEFARKREAYLLYR